MAKKQRKKENYLMDLFELIYYQYWGKRSIIKYVVRRGLVSPVSFFYVIYYKGV